jgi:5-methylcytosine-specific restriction endonuclease McrA
MKPSVERMIYLRRTRVIYDRQQEQARLVERRLGYSLADLRGFLALRLLRGQCTYCGEGLNVQNIEADFLIPISRSGRFSFSNLDGMCQDCFLLRAGLDAQEFRQIWHVLHEWARPLRRHFIDRLRAGTLVVPAAPSFGNEEPDQLTAGEPEQW